MLRVFADAGLPVRRKIADGAVELTFPLPGDDSDQVLAGYLDSVASRESRADVASLRSVLAAGVGGGDRRQPPAAHGRPGHPAQPGGRRVRGPVYAVNPQGQAMEGIACVPAAADLPEPVDLAVLTVPVAAVPEVARGVRPPRGAGPGGDHLGPGRRGRGPAGHLPPARHAAGRAELPGRAGARPSG